MAALTQAQIDYLGSQPLGRIATAGADGRPHVVPVSFRWNPDTQTIDSGGHDVSATKRYRDIQANPYAAIAVDDLASVQPWTPRMVTIRGRAEVFHTGGAELGDGFGDSFIRIHPDKVHSFGIT